MAIYGEYINEEYQILNEMRFSKKDVLNPDTVEKITKRTKFYQSVYEIFIGILALITIILSLVTLGIALIPCGMILSYAYEKLKDLPSNTEDKNIKKFIEKCKQIKDKAEKELQNEKDLNKINKYKEIISLCDKNIKAANEVYNEKIEKEYKSKFEEVKNIYNKLYNYLNKDVFTIGDGYDSDILLLAKQAKIPESVIIDKIDKTKNKNMLVSMSNYFGYIDDYKKFHDENILKQFEIKAFNEENLKLVFQNDEAWLVLTPNNKLLSLYDMKEQKSLYSYLFKSSDKLSDHYDEKIIKDVDISLGYYIFSECPKEIKQKKFI